MGRPTPASLALLRSTLPVRRVAPPLASQSQPLTFASLLQSAQASTATPVGQRLVAPAAPRTMMMSTLRPATPATAPVEFTTAPGAGPAPISRAEILANAQQLMGVPYVWGGTSSTGLDCSAFVSKVWGVSRHTTDTLAEIAKPISKDELQAGDALNLTTGADREGYGHVRLFDRWANAEHTQMWVYEETPPRSLHHVINWDPKYQPMRRLNTTETPAAPPLPGALST